MKSAASLERQLAAEGLGVLDVERDRGVPRVRDMGDPLRGETVTAMPGATLHAVTAVAEHEQASDLWLAWAVDIAATHHFGGKLQRSVWKAYAQGRTLTEIQGSLKVSRRAVTRAIERVEHAVPPAPVRNPWRRSHGQPKTMNDRQLGALVRQLAATDPELKARLMPQEDSMAGKAATNTYKKIIIRSGFEVRVPGIPVAKNELLNVDGRPHAGGIDVEYNDEVVTVPWWKIQQAVRAKEAE